MDPRRKITLSNPILSLVDGDFSARPWDSDLIIRWAHDSEQIVLDTKLSGSFGVPGHVNTIIMQLTVLASGTLTFHVFTELHGNETRLGSVDIDLEKVFDVISQRGSREYTHILRMCREASPSMQLKIEATTFALSLLAPGQSGTHFLAFYIADNTSDPEFYDDSRDFVTRTLPCNMCLLLSIKQFEKLRARCRAVTAHIMKLMLLHSYASLLHKHIGESPLSALRYCHSRLLYCDFGDVFAASDSCTRSLFNAVLEAWCSKIRLTYLLGLQFCGGALLKRFKTGHAVEDLTTAVNYLETVERTSVPLQLMIDRFQLYITLGEAYHARYECTHHLLDLDARVGALEKARALPILCSKIPMSEYISDEDRCMLSGCLAEALIMRFNKLGDQHDLTRAMQHSDEAFNSSSPNDSWRVHVLRQRRDLFRIRWIHLDDEKDLQSCILIDAELVRSPLLSDFRDVHMSAVHLVYRFQRSKRGRLDYEIQTSINDIDQVEIGMKKWLKAEAAGDPADLKRAIQLLQDFMTANPEHDHIGMFQRSLGDAFVARFALLDNQKDLDSAIDLYIDADASNGRHGLGFHAMGQTFILRYLVCGRNTSDLHSALRIYGQAMKTADLSPVLRIRAAEKYANCGWFLGMLGNFFTTEMGTMGALLIMEGMAMAMKLLPSVAWIGMAMQDRLNILNMTHYVIDCSAPPKLRQYDAHSSHAFYKTLGNLPSRAARYAIISGQLELALEWLEQGRSIVWGQLLQFRIPLDGLRAKNKGLADRILRIGKELAFSSTRSHLWGGEPEEFVRGGGPTVDVEGRKHRNLVVEWEEAVAKARTLEGFEKFMCPKEFVDLSAAADDGIVVVINVSATGESHALVLFPPVSDLHEKRIMQVTLQKLGFDDVNKMYNDTASATGADYGPMNRVPVFAPFGSDTEHGISSQFEQVLTDIWYKIVRPVILSAKMYRPELFEGSRPHVRWCPTGRISFLPLHAAGDYKTTESSQPGRVWDYVVSSYIPTLNSIIRPSGDANVPTPHTRRKILAVSCAKVKGQLPLMCVDAEMAHLKIRAASSPSCELVVLTDAEATAERVKEAMKGASWVHFACHGVQDAENPTNSALLLAKGTRLELCDIVAADHPHAELAFLSACHTARGDGKLPSESLHLAAGMLLAGYRSVIATMWPIEDRSAPSVADDVYGYLLRKDKVGAPDYKESALALDLAVKRLREKVGEKSFLTWVPYIHIGV